MAEPPRPGQPGYKPGVWESFALNVGLKKASNVGIGLQLFNALQSRFSGVASSLLGRIASTIGEGLRAVLGLTPAQMQLPVPLESLPIVPADFHPGEQGDRVIAGVTLTFDNQKTGREEIRTVWVNALEVLTPQDLIDEARALFAEAARLGENSPDPETMETIAQLIYLAKRY